MRSRYTAYVTGNIDYIEQTCARNAREEFNCPEVERYIDEMDWQGLDILRVTEGGAEDERGFVDFAFHLKHKGKPYTQREIATFERIDGRWYYTDSEVNPKGKTVHAEKIGRNDPCPCGSEKKYKKCCGS
jgi:SEC-C motif-containing protein